MKNSKLFSSNFLIGFRIGNNISSIGYRYCILQYDTQNVINHYINNFGQPTAVSSGTFGRAYSYDEYGYPTGRTVNITKGPVYLLDHEYNFNAATGNLTSRKDKTRNLPAENFGYDSMNRLTSFGGNTVTYDNAKGNLTSKTDIGSFRYQTPNKPYAISGITTVPSAIPITEQIVTYTSFKKPATITEGIYNATFTYNGSNGRVKMEVMSGGLKEITRYYISDCYEYDTKTNTKPAYIKEKLYLGGDFYSAPAVYVKEGETWQLYYIFRDYLGSIIQIRRHDNDNNHIYEYSYDAWGRLRDPATHTVFGPDNQPTLFLGRGYSGHEHLPWFGLINMNARLYDPAVGRFLSPDPYVQAPDNSQSFNRYSYAFNNPLKYVDPSGGQFIAAEMRHPFYNDIVSWDGWNRALEPPESWSKVGYSYNWVLGCYVNNNTGNVATWNEVSNWMNSNYNIYYSQIIDWHTAYYDKNKNLVITHYIRSEIVYWSECFIGWIKDFNFWGYNITAPWGLNQHNYKGHSYGTFDATDIPLLGVPRTRTRPAPSSTDTANGLAKIMNMFRNLFKSNPETDKIKEQKSKSLPYGVKEIIVTDNDSSVYYKDGTGVWYNKNMKDSLLLYNQGGYQNWGPFPSEKYKKIRSNKKYFKNV